MSRSADILLAVSLAANAILISPITAWISGVVDLQAEMSRACNLDRRRTAKFGGDKKMMFCILTNDIGFCALSRTMPGGGMFAGCFPVSDKDNASRRFRLRLGADVLEWSQDDFGNLMDFRFENSHGDVWRDVLGDGNWCLNNDYDRETEQFACPSISGKERPVRKIPMR